MAYVLVKHKIGSWSEFERTFESGKERRRMLEGRDSPSQGE